MLKRLGVPRDALFEPYSEEADSPSTTQVIAVRARKSGIEAILAPSALFPEYNNLVVFRDNTPSQDAVEVIGFDDHIDGEKASVG